MASLLARTATAALRRHRQLRRHHHHQPAAAVVVLRANFSASSSAKVLRLNDLQDNPGARKQKKRLGRGVGSGRGKTSTRGMKGTKARGKMSVHNEGGQTPITKIFPKRGGPANKHSRQKFAPLNLDKLAHWLEVGALRPERPAEEAGGVVRLSMRDLALSGIVGRKIRGDGIALLGGTRRLDYGAGKDMGRTTKKEKLHGWPVDPRGPNAKAKWTPYANVSNEDGSILTESDAAWDALGMDEKEGGVGGGGGASAATQNEPSKKKELELPRLEIEVSRASAAAIAAVEAAGGSITTVYHDRLGMRALVKPHKFEDAGRPIPRRARPKPAEMASYYALDEKRGEFSALVNRKRWREGADGRRDVVKQALAQQAERRRKLGLDLLPAHEEES